MKISAGKEYKRRHRTLNSIFINNPSLVLGFALPFLVATSTSLKNAAAISIEMFFVHMSTMYLSVIFTRKLERWLRALFTVIISTVCMMLVRELILLLFHDITNSLGMYIYLLAFNGLTLYQSLSLDPRSRPRPVLKRELFHVIAFVVTMFSLSAIREYFGSSTLWGIAVSSPVKLGGFAIPFSGFILLGILIAVVKFFNHKLFGIAITETERRRNRFFASMEGRRSAGL